VGLTNSPTTSTTLGLTVGRQQFPSLYDNYYYMDTGGDVSLRQQLTRSLSVGLLVSYYLTDDKPARRVDNTHGSQDYYAIRVSTLWQLDRYFKTELFYVYCGSGLSERNLVVQENQVGMELHLNF
jgi:outer membrane protein assembly factor BamA